MLYDGRILKIRSDVSAPLFEQIRLAESYNMRLDIHPFDQQNVPVFNFEAAIKFMGDITFGFLQHELSEVEVFFKFGDGAGFYVDGGEFEYHFFIVYA